MSKQYSLYDCQIFAKQRNGQCLNNYYPGFRAKMRWMCNKRKITFELSLAEIFAGKWGPQYQEDVNEEVVVHEPPIIIEKNIRERCQDSFFNVIGKDFPPSSPDWTYGVELDGYNDFVEIAFLIITLDVYKSMIDRNNPQSYLEFMAKKELCEENDVTVIEIPYWIQNIDKFIEDKLDE